jgi:hypothetical protein
VTTREKTKLALGPYPRHNSRVPHLARFREMWDTTGVNLKPVAGPTARIESSREQTTGQTRLALTLVARPTFSSIHIPM